MLLQKTEKARAELRPGARSLGQRERTVLLLADGSRTLDDLKLLYDGEGEQITLLLIRDGFLVAATEPAAFNRTRSGSFAIGTGARVADLVPEPPAAPPATTPPPALVVPQASPAGADSFEGKRSLATTRMFLFDLCERMFARRDPIKAQGFREALRNAKDRETMLSAAREMIGEIEHIAGAERADSISERIAMLLPPE